MSIFNLQRFVYNIRRFNECFYNKNLLIFVTIGDNTSTTVYLKSNYGIVKSRYEGDIVVITQSQGGAEAEGNNNDITRVNGI